MEYTEEFTRRVKAAYPGHAKMHQALDHGSEMVGRYLDDSRVQFEPMDIIAATSLEELKQEARHALERERLYQQWCELYEKQVWPHGGFEGIASEYD